MKKGKRFLKKYLFAIIIIIICGKGFSQTLNNEDKLTVVLHDNISVTLYGKAIDFSDAKSNQYYYLPTNVRLSKKKDGTPEFLFTKFTTEKSETQGGISGAIMHFLMEWGLTPQQETELKDILKTKHNNAVLLGAVDLLPSDDESFRVISAIASDKGMTSSLVTSGRAPVLPGSKFAIAIKLDKYGAQLMASTLEKSKSISDLSLDLSFKFNVKLPAAKGRIRIDWTKFQTFIDAKISHDSLYWNPGPYQSKFINAQMDSIYQKCIEMNIIRFDWEESITDDRIAKIRDAFSQVFINAISTPTPEPPTVIQSQNHTENNDGNLDVTQTARYYQAGGWPVILDARKVKRKIDQKTEVINLNMRLAVAKPMSITCNLADWYNGVRDNPKCVNTVNLNDPFFSHRDINFILDLEAKEMFEQEVNYVTVNVRKKRTSGNSFEDHITIDKDYLTKNGISASTTYARGEDRDPDLFEYQTQWSLRGGNIYPVTPPWTKGSWEAVTLDPPIQPRTIEFEANIDEMKAANISRATLQVRFVRFGKETEENIAVSPAKNEPLTSKMIFTDRNTKGYVYRLIFNHTTEGKLALDWQPKINDDYVYAVIPEQLKDKESDIFKKAKEAARTIVPPASDGTVTSDKVIDGFKQIFGIIKEAAKTK